MTDPARDSIKVRNWSEFQHYKDRFPPWIKLHRSLLDSPEYASLDDFSARLLVALWLLASETRNGEICLDPAALAWRLRDASGEMEEKVRAALQVLVSKRLISAPLAWCKQDASALLATCKTEERRGETEERVKKNPSGSKKATSFPDGWTPKPTHSTRAEAMHLDVASEAEAFEDHHVAKGNRFVDWDRAFLTWLRNADSFRQRNGKPGTGVTERDRQRIAALGY